MKRYEVKILTIFLFSCSLCSTAWARLQHSVSTNGLNRVSEFKQALARHGAKELRFQMSKESGASKCYRYDYIGAGVLFLTTIITVCLKLTDLNQIEDILRAHYDQADETEKGHVRAALASLRQARANSGAAVATTESTEPPLE